MIAINMTKAEEKAKESCCNRTKVGAVLESLFGRTYSACNGNSKCHKEGCLRPDARSGENLDSCRGVHAEQRVIMMAGLECRGATLYVTHYPCPTCARMIVYSGISTVCYKHPWGPFELSRQILEEGGVQVVQLQN